FARLGRRPCPNCGQEVPPSFDAARDDWAGEGAPGEEPPAPDETYPCPHCGAPVPEMSMAHFSFNKPEGACPTCTGLGTVFQANLPLLVDEAKSVRAGAITGWDQNYTRYFGAVLEAAAAHF